MPKVVITAQPHPVAFLSTQLFNASLIAVI